ncbi:protein regulator of cytokinesis 1-like [Diabrotica virgifera virgifera]|uniref:Protein regulator of cytokinesis 1-like isoform X2 n=1 Tax=Diabrotica virgifera virgifera TaxID=50390 RepID=A0A6P7FHX1_DIAVI|nr:protein regulator of cytokinesis 1-like [Diabrotica virgifera virgifera]
MDINVTMDMSTSSICKLKDLDMEIIKDVPWAQSMWNTLQMDLQKSFLNWVEVVLAMSQNEEDVTGWKDTYIRHFEDRCYEMVTDIKELHEQVIENIEKYLNRIQVLCKMLQIEMPVIGTQKLGLYQEQLKLKRQIMDLEQMVKARQSTLDQLRNKQLELSKALGKAPLLLNDNHLPSPQEIIEFQKHVEELEQEKFDRLEKYTTLKEELLDMVKELEYQPSTNFENEVINGSERNFMVTEENIEKLETFYGDMKKALKDTKEEVCQLWNNIEHLWTLLDIDFMEREEIRKKYTGYSLSTLESLRLEWQKYELLKKANIKVFVEKLRQELQLLWERCHCSESVKKEFLFFNSETYTEDLLELHEVQLKKWQIYAEENKEILAALHKHRTLWEKLIELERSAAGPDRFNNRGGKLLLEEKERNLLSKKIPILETNLMESGYRYEARHGVPFLTFGETIEEYINNLHSTRESSRKLKLSARKQQKETTTHTPLCTTNVMTSKRVLMGASCTDAKKFRETPRKVYTEPKRKPRALNTPSIAVGTLSRSKRLSMERRKRIEKMRRLSRQKENHQINATYTEFENNFNSRVECRSTLNAAETDNNLLAVPETTSNLKTPTKTVQKSLFKTPTGTARSPRSTAKSPNTTSKLTAAKSQLKLIF